MTRYKVSLYLISYSISTTNLDYVIVLEIYVCKGVNTKLNYFCLTFRWCHLLLVF